MKNYTLLALGLSALPISCKKEEDKNDPNIDDRIINHNIAITGTLTEASGSIDVNLDGVNDFDLGVYVENDGGIDYVANYIEATGNDNEILIEYISINASFDVFTKALAENTSISSYSTIWNYSGYGQFSVEGEFNEGNIKAGSGDKYIGFRLEVGTNWHYGWMKVNVASNGKTITIKEVAYNKTANTPIKAGEK